jgi:hypothetical protein
MFGLCSLKVEVLLQADNTPHRFSCGRGFVNQTTSGLPSSFRHTWSLQERITPVYTPQARTCISQRRRSSYPVLSQPLTPSSALLPEQAELTARVAGYGHRKVCLKRQYISWPSQDLLATNPGESRRGFLRAPMLKRHRKRSQSSSSDFCLGKVPHTLGHSLIWGHMAN